MSVIIGKEPYIHERCLIKNSELGEYTEIGYDNYLENVEFGRFSYSGQHCIIQNAVIKGFSNIAAMVRIGPVGHPTERPALHHFTYRRKMYGFCNEDDAEFFKQRESKMITIGNDTWIGHGAIIMPGIVIGDGAVIGSGAVVTRNVHDYTVVAGVPARLLRKRFDDETAKRLKEICWWEWSYDEIAERIADFSLDVNEFIKKNPGRRKKVNGLA